MRRRRASRRSGHTNNFWQSYSDIMAALLLVFVLVLTGTMLQSHEEFERKQAELEEALETIKEQEAQLAKIMGIRQSIIEALKEQFSEDELTIDTQTGAIVFNADLMFEFGSAKLSDKGKEYLTNFLPQYFGVLLSDEFSEYVAEITIEGHTDTVSTYLYNLDLSQQRARNVAAFFLSDSQTLFSQEDLQLLRQLVTANGRSESDPIYEDDGVTVDMDASRRVEIQFRLRDSEMIQQMLDAIS